MPRSLMRAITPISMIGPDCYRPDRFWGTVFICPTSNLTAWRRGVWIAHCPSSNEALGSGRMDLKAVRRHRIRFALASDVGAGPSHSMLHVMQRFLAQHQEAGEPVTIQEALFRSTLAGADCLRRKAITGSFEPGKRADFVLLPRTDSPASPEAWLTELCTGSASELEQRPLGTWLEGEPVAYV